MHKIYIGFDDNEVSAYHACVNSIEHNTKSPVTVLPLQQDELRNNKIYNRPIDDLGSTQFTFTRFLVPYLCEYEGWSLFIDCDFIFLDDIDKLFSLCDDRYAVMCVKHDYRPTSNTKMGGKTQYVYPRKNWSSLVLWNNAHPANSKVTPSLVNTESAQFLHRFTWLDDSDIGSVSHEWNWLVDWYTEPIDGKPKALHYTEGGPWIDGYYNCSYNKEWYKYDRM